MIENYQDVQQLAAKHAQANPDSDFVVLSEALLNL